MALKNCKECGKEVSSQAKKCPHCGAYTKNWFLRHKFLSFIGAFILFIIFIAALSGNDDTPATVSAPQQEQQEVIAEVGDMITTNKFEIIVTSVEERKKVGSGMFENNPAEGGIFIAVKWQYKNISDTPIGSFSTPYIRLLDKNNTRHSSDIGASGSFATELNLDRKILSELNPGITVKDASIFEVSKELFDSGGWKLLVNADKNAYVKVN